MPVKAVTDRDSLRLHDIDLDSVLGLAEVFLSFLYPSLKIIDL